MSERGYARLAGSLFGTALLFLFFGFVLWTPEAEFFVFFSLVAAPFAVVGVLVASRRSGNPVGWLFLVFATVAAFVAFSDRYAAYALIEHPGTLPGGVWVAWVSSGVWHPAFGFFVFAFLLFPNGRLPSPWWRPVAYFAGFVYFVGAVVGLLWGPLFGEFFPDVEAPFRLPEYLFAEAAFGFFLICNFALLALSALSLVLRLRRSSGIERQQLKWFVYAVALFALTFPPSVAYFGDGRLIVFLLPYVPAAAGVAILRHRLFDIDVVINRTLVYGALTAALLGVYFAGVGVLQYLLRVATGEGSQLAVVASTLVIAVLFSPLRRRTQSAIDRRFYKRKYDAARTLEEFSSRLREEMDLESLRSEVLAVVQDTVQPENVSLWLRESSRNAFRPRDGCAEVGAPESGRGERR